MQQGQIARARVIIDEIEQVGTGLQATVNFAAAGGQRCPELDALTLLETGQNTTRFSTPSKRYCVQYARSNILHLDACTSNATA